MAREYRAGRPLKTVTGYIRIWEPTHPLAFKDGTVLMHRKVWFDYHGSIPKGTHVHHKNGDKTDNRIENLEVHSNSEHQLVHQQEGATVKNQYGIFKVKPVSDRASTKWPSQRRIP